MTEITTNQTTNLDTLKNRVSDIMENAKADNTKRAYKADWRDFLAFCQKHALSSLPASPDTVTLYLSQLAETKKMATIRRRVASIAEAHRVAGLATPTTGIVKTLLSGLARSTNQHQTRKKALRVSDLADSIPLFGDDLRGCRDKAILLLGFAGGFRRSEITNLVIGDITFTDSGMMITIRQSKTDQAGQGMTKTIGNGRYLPTCAVSALRLYLKGLGKVSGPVFRNIKKGGEIIGNKLTPQSVAAIVKKAVSLCGLNPDSFGGHSLRSGHITAAKQAGIMTEEIMKTTGHKDPSMITRYYQGGTREQYQISRTIGL
jgi:integrase